jgi:hypothetical protein
MLIRYDSEGFTGKPANAFQLILKQKSRVYCNYHVRDSDKITGQSMNKTGILKMNL